MVGKRFPFQPVGFSRLSTAVGAVVLANSVESTVLEDIGEQENWMGWEWLAGLLDEVQGTGCVYLSHN